MTDRELNKVLKALEQIPNEKERDDAMQIVLKAASESITLERLKKISSFREEEKKKEEGQGFIKFTKKEIESMPEIIQRLFVFDEKVITENVEETIEKLTVLKAVQVVLKDALSLIGVSAPEKMEQK